MITINNLSKNFYEKSLTGNVIQNICLTFPDKGMFFLLGPSGSGKTTLLNIIGCLLEPSSGEVLVGSTNPFSLSREKRELFRLQNFSFIFQEYNLVPDYDVLGNLLLSKKIRDEAKSRNFENITHLCQIDSLFERRPGQLSTGQKQRVCIARALINETPIILADEPTGSIDSMLSDEIFALLKEVSRSRLVIIASHDRNAAFKYGDSVYEIQNGTIASPIMAPLPTKTGETPLLERHHTPLAFDIGLASKGVVSHMPIFCLSIALSLIFGSAMAPLYSFFGNDISGCYVESLYLDDVKQIQFSAGMPYSNINDSAATSLSLLPGFVKVAFAIDDQYVPMNFPSGNHVDSLSGIAIYDDSVAERYPLAFGHLPSQNSTDVLITKETYDTLAIFGFLDGTPVTTYQDVIGKDLPSGIISGIIDTKASPEEAIADSQHNFYYINPDSVSRFLENPFSSIYRINDNPKLYQDYPIIGDSYSNLTGDIQMNEIGEPEYLMLCDGKSVDEGFIVGAESHFTEARDATYLAINNHIQIIWSPNFASRFSLLSGIDSPTESDYFDYILAEKNANEMEDGMTYYHFFHDSAESIVADWPRTVNLLLQPKGNSYFKKENLAVVGFDFGSSDTTLSASPDKIFEVYSSTMNGSISRLSYRLSGTFSQDKQTIHKALMTTSEYPLISSDETSISLVERVIAPMDDSSYENVAYAKDNKSSLYGSMIILSIIASISLLIILSALFFMAITADKERNGILLSLGLSKKNLKISYYMQAAAISLFAGIFIALLSFFAFNSANKIAFALTGLALFDFSWVSAIAAAITVFFVALLSMIIVDSRLSRLDVIDLVKRDI